MKNKIKLAKFLADKIDKEDYGREESYYDIILERLVEFEEQESASNNESEEKKWKQ